MWLRVCEFLFDYFADDHLEIVPGHIREISASFVSDILFLFSRKAQSPSTAPAAFLLEC